MKILQRKLCHSFNLDSSECFNSERQRQKSKIEEGTPPLSPSMAWLSVKKNDTRVDLPGSQKTCTRWPPSSPSSSPTSGWPPLRFPYLSFFSLQFNFNMRNTVHHQICAIQCIAKHNFFFFKVWTQFFNLPIMQCVRCLKGKGLLQNHH